MYINFTQNYGMVHIRKLKLEGCRRGTTNVANRLAPTGRGAADFVDTMI
jgi:hypothetical protein